MRGERTARVSRLYQTRAQGPPMPKGSELVQFAALRPHGRGYVGGRRRRSYTRAQA